MRFLFAFHQLVDAWRKFANSVLKVIMLWYSRNSRLKNINLFRNSLIRKLESCECRFLWKNGNYLRTTSKTFACHRLGTPDWSEMWKVFNNIMVNCLKCCNILNFHCGHWTLECWLVSVVRLLLSQHTVSMRDAP